MFVIERKLEVGSYLHLSVVVVVVFSFFCSSSYKPSKKPQPTPKVISQPNPRPHSQTCSANAKDPPASLVSRPEAKLVERQGRKDSELRAGSRLYAKS